MEERFRVLSRLRPWLLKRAQRLVYGRSDAEDLVQEVFAKFVAAFQDVPPPDEQGSMAWLAKALRNAFISGLRKKGVHLRAEPDPTLKAFVSPAEDDPSDRPFSDTITDEELKLAMQSLSPKQREVFEANARGLRYAEIAQQLDIREGAVAKRIFDARQRLKKRLLQIRGRRTPPKQGGG